MRIIDFYYGLAAIMLCIAVIFCEFDFGRTEGASIFVGAVILFIIANVSEHE